MPTRATARRAAERTRLTRVPLAPAFDVLRAAFVAQRFAPHMHAEYAIGVVESGRGRIAHANGVDEHPPGAIIVIPPGLAHEGEAIGADGLSYRMFYLPALYLQRATPRSLGVGALYFPKVAIDDPPLAHRLIGLHRAMEEGAHSLAELGTELAAVLRLLIARHATTAALDARRPPTPGVRLARAFIDARFRDRLTISQVSAVAALSPFHLIRAFRRAYGLTPYAYLEQQRVEYARTLIAAGERIAIAALAAGFSDQSHLTKRFRRTLGVTPGVFARRTVR